MAETLNLGVAFIGGIISFFSPCIIPIIPGFLSYLAGVSIKELEQRTKKRWAVFYNTVFFVIGFMVVFTAAGLVIGAITQLTGFNIQRLIARIGGILIILFGLYTIGLLKIPFLEREHKLRVKTRKKSHITSAIFGAAFAIAWTPCVTAILAAILVLAGTLASALHGAYLLFSFSVGLALPFLITGLFTVPMQKWILKYQKHFMIVNIIAGILLVLLGIVVFTGNLQRIVGYIIG